MLKWHYSNIEHDDRGVWETRGMYFQGPDYCLRALYCASKQVSKAICLRNMFYCLAPTRV